MSLGAIKFSVATECNKQSTWQAVSAALHALCRKASGLF